MESQQKERNIPTIFIIFGATGDLMEKKIIPSLYHLYSKGRLPKLFKIIGVSRREWESKQFQEFVREKLITHLSRKKIKSEDLSHFLSYFIYRQGNFDEYESYRKLAELLGRSDNEWRVCSNKLFYLAVPPQLYKKIFEHLHSSGLTIPCSPEEGYTRVLVEKPFGHDLKTAEELDALLGKLFKEEQLYRIDHYLAKEMLQSILSFRFANDLFERRWNKDFIEKIEVCLNESIGIEGRGGYYDGIGALKDVGQNHLLQMLSLVTMDRPLTLQTEEVRAKRAEVLSHLVIPNTDYVKRFTFRGQYKGYRQESGVNPISQTETYFKVLAYLDTPSWRGVPIVLEGGKKLPRKKEIVVTFKHSTPCLCPAGEHLKNKITFSLEPKEEIAVEFWVKKPGLEYSLQKRTLNYLYRDARRKVQYIEEYEKLLLDCIAGNQLLFVSTDEVKYMWKLIDPIISAWSKNAVPLHMYEGGKKKILVESDKVLSANVSKYIKAESDKRTIGIVGLGKMGGNIARRLAEKGWRVVGYNRTPQDTKQFESEGGEGAYSIEELVRKLPKPRAILLSLPAGKVTDEMIGHLISFLEPGDYLIDGANGFYKDAVKNAEKLKKNGIHFADVGISGGPGGARSGACIMVGGKQEVFNHLEPLFHDMAIEDGVAFFPGYGAGHFVKMVHNGIEYGMMHSLAEGFDILKHSDYNLDLARVAEIYNHGSVIESRLVGWLKDGLELFGENLEQVSGSVAHTGEGDWTVETAREMNIQAKVIEDALQFRIDSEKNPSYAGKVLSALRNMFGGHAVKDQP